MSIPRTVDAYAVTWCGAVVASLVVPDEAARSRPTVAALVGLCAAGWALAVAVSTGRVPLPASWRRWARQPLSSHALLVLGAAVGPSLLLFILACRRAVAVDRQLGRSPLGGVTGTGTR